MLESKYTANASEGVNNEPNPCSANFNEYIREENFKKNMRNLTTKQKSEICKLVDTYKSIFAKDKRDVGTVREYEYDG